MKAFWLRAAVFSLLAWPVAAFAPDEARETGRVIDPSGPVEMAIGPASPMAAPATETLTGTRTRIAWASGRRTATDLMDDLLAQLAQDGFDLVFTCQTDQCGGFDFRLSQPLLPMPEMFVNLGDFRYVALTRPMPPAHAAVLVSQTPGGAFAQLTLTEPGPPTPTRTDQNDIAAEQPGPTPDAALLDDPVPDMPQTTGDLAARLAATGRSVLPGVVFAPGAATLTGLPPASLRALAGWLGADPSRRIALVGHSDWTGAPDANVSLSRRRASAVADAVVGFGASRRQITVAGVGPYAPIRPNDTDAGRTANRRVEAVVLQPAP